MPQTRKVRKKRYVCAHMCVSLTSSFRVHVVDAVASFVLELFLCGSCPFAIAAVVIIVADVVVVIVVVVVGVWLQLQ